MAGLPRRLHSLRSRGFVPVWHDPGRLAADRDTLSLMCAAVTEGFAALRRAGISGLPRNLAILHTPLLRMVAVRYWARTMRSPMGELCFAAHSRHGQAEMQDLAAHLVERIGNAPAPGICAGS